MTIKLHHLRPAPGAKTDKTRVGRGEGSKGKTAGRGTKGTKRVRTSRQLRRWPDAPAHASAEAQGFKNAFRTEYQVVNVSDIARVFPEGGQIGVDELVANGLVRKNQLVKVLGEGEITVAVQVSANKFSGSAKEKIAAAGGTATELA